MVKTNVVDISSNSKFKGQKMIPLPKGASPSRKYDTFELEENLFGFMRGDELICQIDFTEKDITENTLVIADSPKGQRVMPAFLADDIQAIVVGFIREVSR